MTLNVTLLTEQTIFQSADLRLTNLDTRQVQSDTSTKLVVLQYAAGDGFVSYTGIGRWRGRDTSEYIIEWLAGTADATPAEIAERLCEKGTEWLTEIEAQIGRQRHTFILAAFHTGAPQLWVISNFEDCYGRDDASAAPALSVSTWRYAGQARVVVTGAKPAVARPQRRRLDRLVQRDSDPGRIRRALAEVNAEAAASGLAHGTISEACSVVSFRADGQGFGDVVGPVDVRTIANGVVLPEMREIAKMLGISNPQLGGVTFASSKPPVPYAPCSPVVITPAASVRYALREATHSEFVSCRALAVSDAGVVLGDGNPPSSRAEYILWTSPIGGPVTPCSFLASPGGINSRGQVAAKAVMTDGSERAIRWRLGDSIPEDLGSFRGRDSGARAINEAGVVAGWVCIDAVNRGQGNFRPAVWPTSSSSIRVLEDLGGEGGEVVALNGRGGALVVTFPPTPAAPVRAVLWNLQTDAVEPVGGKAKGIFPTAITDEAIVLGTARDASGNSVAAIARPGRSWEKLGTPAGFYATAMNNRGEVVGATKREGYEKPWLRLASGEIVWLPYFEHHWCRPLAASNAGVIVGTAQSDHGTHALVWAPA